MVYLKLPEVEARANGTQDALLVKVTTDAGITGVGEVDSLPLAAKAIIEAPLSNSIASGLRELIVGEDPFAYEKIWQRMYLGSRYPGRRGAVVHAMSGVDLALWDIMGKALKMPAHQLLGGPFRTRLRAYASTLFGDSLQETADQTSRLWRLVGSRCADIRGLGPAAFAWEDGQGSRMSWEVAERSPGRHVWYAEGEIKAGAWLPRVSVKAVLVADHAEGTDGQGHAVVRHRLTLFLHADGRAVAAAARIVGASAPRLAEQYLGQVETFFGAMAWYLENHPDHARLLMEQLRRPADTDPPQVPPPARAGAGAGGE